MSDAAQVKSILSLDPDTYLELFDIYVDESYGFVRIHSGKNLNKNIVYRGNTYLSCPIEFGGVEYNSSGKQPRPTIRIANTNGLITNYIKNKNDLNNCTLKRTKVFLKNIDDVNFPEGLNPFYGLSQKWSFPNYGPQFFSDTYIINSKLSENKYVIEFELSSPLDLENIFLPSRKILDNLCPWVYRGAGCCYGKINNFTQKIKNLETGGDIFFNEIGAPLADEFNKEFVSSEGYNLPTLTQKGVWNPTGEYTTGDFVLVQSSFSYDFNKENIQPSSDDLVGDYYVCVNTGVSGLNPKLDKENWVKDSCSKNLQGCKIRWQKYVIVEEGQQNLGLPYGGFPGTRPFEYRT